MLMLTRIEKRKKIEADEAHYAFETAVTDFEAGSMPAFISAMAKSASLKESQILRMVHVACSLHISVKRKDINTGKAGWTYTKGYTPPEVLYLLSEIHSPGKAVKLLTKQLLFIVKMEENRA